VPSLLIKFNAGCECDARRAQPGRERGSSDFWLVAVGLGCYNMEMGSRSLICARDHEMHCECVACVLETRRNALLATLLLIIPRHFWCRRIIFCVGGENLCSNYAAQRWEIRITADFLSLSECWRPSLVYFYYNKKIYISYFLQHPRRKRGRWSTELKNERVQLVAEVLDQPRSCSDFYTFLVSFFCSEFPVPMNKNCWFNNSISRYY
jgi:hypothetical protein